MISKANSQAYASTNCRDSESNDASFCFSQLMHYISHTNYQNLWKFAYHKYSNVPLNTSYQPNIGKNIDKTSINLMSYNEAMRDVISRMYNVPILHAQLDRSECADKCSSTIDYPSFDAHMNLCPVICAIETSSSFIIVFNSFIENNLLDCVMYSPALLSQSHNKPLFIIYQLLQLISHLHSRGLFLGNIGLCDIYLEENLWLHIFPLLNESVLTCQDKIWNKNENSIKDNEQNSLSQTLQDYCKMWSQGKLSNYDYLTILNNLSGRRLGCPQFHHIMPWVTDFTSRNGSNWRDLKKSKYRLNKGDAQLDLMFSQSTEDAVPHHVSDILSEITYFVYMARRTPKNILCRHVRSNW